MEAEVTKKLCTREDYHRMGEAGIFHPEAHLELIEGEILEMSPVGTRHIACVNRATALFVQCLEGRAMVSVRNPVVLSDDTEPQPDLLLAPPRDDFYASHRISASDALLAIEVSDTTIRQDRNRKMPLYARAGVPELWICDLSADGVLVYRDPADDGYATAFSVQRGDELNVQAFPDFSFKVEGLLG